MLTVVLDTGVLVSSMSSPKGPPAKFLDLVMGEHIRVAYDDRILGEYEDILTPQDYKFLHLRRWPSLITLN